MQEELDQTSFTIYQMNENDDSLHHEYSQSVTKEDQKSVTLIMDYILERGNPCNTDKPPLKFF